MRPASAIGSRRRDPSRPVYAPGAMGPPVAALQQMLAGYGYGLAAHGVYDEATRDAVAAFQRHFRREKVDGVADLSTIETLRALMQSLPLTS